MNQGLFTKILLKKLEAKLLADVLPPSHEKYELEHKIVACDTALALLRAKHLGRYYNGAPVTPAH